MAVESYPPRESRILLRIEGVAFAAAAIFAYSELGQGWWLFAALILVPDISMLGYLRSPRVGARTYNAVHLWIWPVVFVVAGYLVFTGEGGSPTLLAIGLIWAAHIGIDRALGYGLKHVESFQFTHLGPIGDMRRRAAGQS